MKYVWDGHVLKLRDLQWMNIVNADYSEMSKDDAIHAAVKATEEMMSENAYNRFGQLWRLKVNANNAKDYLPLVQALSEGKVIQFRLEGEERWNDAPNLSFAYALDQYRIKPEPKEIWRNRYPDGSESATQFTSARAAMLATDDPKAIQVRYREVIE